MSIYIYISTVYTSIYIYWKKEQGLGMHSFQKNATFSHSFAFFSKERNILAFFCVLYKKNAAVFAFFYVVYKRTMHSLRSLNSLQKNVAFFAFFYVLCKRTLHSLRYFTFLRKECKRTHCFFGSHKSPKTLKKNVKERKRTLRSLKERKRTMRSEVKEQGAQPWERMAPVSCIISLL